MRYIVIFDDPDFKLDDEKTKEQFRLEVVTSPDVIAGLHTWMSAEDSETQKWALLYKMVYLYMQLGLWYDTR